jgi:hypothetical protein
MKSFSLLVYAGRYSPDKVLQGRLGSGASAGLGFEVDLDQR